MEFLKTFIITLLICSAWQQSFAQMSTVKSDQSRGIYSIKGDYYFDHQNLIKAIDYYGKSVKEKPKDTYSMLRMAEAYYKTDDIKSADLWYKKALKLDPKIEAKYDLNGLETLNLKSVESKNSDPGELESISIFTSDGNEITLIGNPNGIFSLSIETGFNYNLFIDRINNKENASSGGSDETISTLKMDDGETYNFHIEKFANSDDKTVEGGKVTEIQNAIGSPGEMITFQFLPDFSTTSNQDTRQNTTKLLYQNNEVTLNNSDTIVFGYVIKGDLQDTEPEQEMIAADTLPEVDQSLLLAKNALDTNKLADNALGKHMEIDANSAQNDEEMDDLQYRLLLTASTTKLTEEELKALYSGDQKVEYYEEDGFFIYYISEEPNYFAAEQIKEESGMEDAVIVAYKDGVRQEMNLTEIKKQELSLNSSSGKTDLAVPVLITASSTKLTEEELNAIYSGDEQVDYYEEDGNYNYFIAQKAILPSAGQTQGERDLYEVLKINTNLASTTDEMDDLQYRLLITASTTKLTEEELKALYSGDQKVEYYEEDGLYIYYIAEEPTFFAAEQIKEESGMEEAIIVAYKDGVKQELNLPEIKKQELLLNPSNSSGDDTDLPYPVLINASPSKLTEEQLKTIYPGDRNVDYFEEDGNFNYFVAQAPNFLSAEQIGAENGLYETIMINPVLASTAEGADDLQYRLLLTASTTKLTEEELKALYTGDQKVEYYEEDGLYIYYIAEEPTFFAAEQLKEESGMEDAVIVAYKDGVRQEMNLTEIKKQELSLNSSGGKTNLAIPVLITASSTKLTEEELNAIYSGDQQVDYYEEDGNYNYFIAQEAILSSAGQTQGERDLYEVLKINTNLASTTADDLQYRLLITASTTILSEEELKAIYSGDQKVEYYEEGGLYIYYIAEEPTFFAAEQIKEESGMEEAIIVAYKDGVKQELNLPEIKMQELLLNPSNSSGDDAALPYPVLIKASPSKLTEEQLKTIYAGDRNVDYFEEDGNYNYFVAQAPNFLSAEQIGTENGMYETIMINPDLASTTEGADDLQYRLLITASTTKLSEEELKAIYSGDQKVEYYEEDGLYIYYIAEEPTFFAAEQIKEESGMEEAIIVAYKGGVKQELNLPEIKKQELLLNPSNSSGDDAALPYPVLIKASPSKLTEEQLKTIYAGDRNVDYFEEDGNYNYFVAQAPNFLSAEQIGAENGMYETIMINPNLASTTDEADDLQYRLLLTASTTKLTEEELKALYSGDQKVEYYEQDGLYVYYIAEESNYFATEQIKEETGVEEAIIVAYNDGVRHKLNLPETKKRDLSLNSSNYFEGKTGHAIPVLITASSTKLTEEELNAIYSGDQQVDYYEEDGTYNYFIAQAPNFLSTGQTEGEKGLYQILMADTDLASTTYRVQIAASKSKLTEEELKAIYFGDLEPKYFEEEGYFKYYISEGPDYFATEQIMNESGVEKAFIAAYKGSVKQEYTVQEILLAEKAQNSADAHDDLTGIMDEMEDLQYRVQIRASKSKLSKKQLKAIYNGDQTPKYFKEDGYYKYYIAQDSNYFAAKKILNETGVKNAFIVAYKEGVKYDLQDAIAAQYKKRMLKEITDMNDSIIEIVTVNFKLDEFTLTPDEKSSLQEFVANQLVDQNQHYVIVNGHTDIRGSDTYNFGLSEERALFVKEMIIEEGISPERVKSFYFGETQLAKNCNEHDNCDESVHEANRRVEIFLITSESSENHARNSSQTLSIK